MPRSSILLAIAIACLALVGGCARQPSIGVTTLQPASLSELQSYLLNNKADVDQFRLRGPFDVDLQKDFKVRLSPTESINTDLFLSAQPEKAPLVVILHGYDNSKDNHSYQAMHVASWGMHSLTLQLPNTGPWLGNGKLLSRIVSLIHAQPELISSSIDASRIILVGHSFGGSAVAIALAQGAPAAGGILLDPAGIGRSIPGFLARINKPVMLLKADVYYSQTVDRAHFFYFIRSGVAEISIKGATHEDAQFPMEPAPLEPGEEQTTTEELQITFVSALTSSAFSLAATGKFDYAWTSFADAIGSGKFVEARKK